MKTFRSPKDVIAEIECLIAEEKPSPHPPSLLVRVAQMLRDSRHYYRVGIYLEADGRVLRQAVCGPELPQSGPSPELAAQYTEPVRIAGRVLGRIHAESERQFAFGAEDRVLLKDVAGLLAAYLTGKGKFLVRKAREAARESATALALQPRPQPSSEKPEVEAIRRAVAGEKSHS